MSKCHKFIATKKNKKVRMNAKDHILGRLKVLGTEIVSGEQ